MNISARLGRTVAVISILVGLSGSTTGAQEAEDEPSTFLKSHVDFSDKDVERVHQGEIVVKSLKTRERSEVAVFGVVRIPGNVADILSLVDDVEEYADENTTRIGRLSETPRLEDFALLSLPEQDVESLRKCKPGDCDIKLSANAIERLQAEIDWSAPDHAERANALFRRVLLDYVLDYQARGNAALMVYAHDKEPAPLADSFAALLGDSPYLYEYVPESHSYLESYPAARPANARDFFFWSIEDFGLKPTIRLMHVTILQGGEGGAARLLVLTKLLYASHYYRGYLGVSSLEAGVGPEAGGEQFVLGLDRTSSDGMSGLVGRVARSKLQNGMRDRMQAWLQALVELSDGK